MKLFHVIENLFSSIFLVLCCMKQSRNKLWERVQFGLARQTSHSPSEIDGHSWSENYYSCKKVVLYAEDSSTGVFL